MKNPISISILFGLCMAPLCAIATTFDDYAKVVSVSERTDQYIQPRQECVSDNPVTREFAGDHAQNSGATVSQPVQRCHSVDIGTAKVIGYAVTYEYQGHRYTDNVSFNPGGTIRLRVHLVPQK